MWISKLSMRSTRRLVALGAALTVAASCASHDDTGREGNIAPSAALDGASASNTALDAGPGLDANVALPRESGRPLTPPPDASGSPEVCDGRDNDGDGLIDNVDLGLDGICDCLFLATLGVPGTHATGNIFGAWLSSRSQTGAAALTDQVLTPALLAKYQVIIAQDLSTMKRTYSSSEIDALVAWVRAGGGLMTLSGYSAPAERTNSNAILARFGMTYTEKLILLGGGKTVPVTMWLGPHPVSDGVTRIGIDYGYSITGDGQTLAQEAGFTLMQVKEVDQGHVVVWADEWITYDSEWSQHPEYQVERLWLNIVKWLTQVRSCQVPLPVLL